MLAKVKKKKKKNGFKKISDELMFKYSELKKPKSLLT